MDKELANKLFSYDDGKLYWKSNLNQFSRAKIGLETGYVAGDGYKRTKINQKLYGTHQIIFLMFYGYLPKQIDHINRDRLDNRIENLRAATNSQNQHNKSIPKNNTSGIQGVTWNKRAKKWYVQLMFNKKPMYFGVYKDLELAELVITEARRKYHGDFASC